MKKIRFIKSSSMFVEKEITEYFHQPYEQFIKMFLPEGEYELVEENESADICFYSVQLEDENILRSNELNIFLSIENFSHWGHYKHMNKFGRYGCKSTNIYISNDESEIKYVRNMKIIPVILCRINYFNNMIPILTNNIPFENKKFLLITSKNWHNKNKIDLIKKLEKHGKIDHIAMYPQLNNKTCYHGSELIHIYNQYKFVMAFENSHSDGYITEKIFNVFLSKSIPIYDGAPDINKYINPKSYIKYDENIEKKITILNNENVYNKVINEEIINSNYKNLKLEY